MIRLDVKEARKKYGRINPLKSKTSHFKHRRNFPDTKYSCMLSCLHDARRGEEWAKKIHEIINSREEL